MHSYNIISYMLPVNPSINKPTSSGPLDNLSGNVFDLLGDLLLSFFSGDKMLNYKQQITHQRKGGGGGQKKKLCGTPSSSIVGLDERITMYEFAFKIKIGLKRKKKERSKKGGRRGYHHTPITFSRVFVVLCWIYTGVALIYSSKPNNLVAYM